MAFKLLTDNGLVDAEDAESDVLTDANAYVDFETFVSYWLDRGTDYSDYDPEVVQAAIVRATDFMERKFYNQFLGRRLYTYQALSWPRSHVYDEDGEAIVTVPLVVRHACAEYAARTLGGTDLWADSAGAPNVRRKVVSIGPIREETEYTGGSAAPIEFPLAESLLGRYMAETGRVYR
jgi:hypothetical protein